MRLAFINPHGNFDAANSHLAAHPDFGGQLVYVREVSRALASLGHEVDILTRRVVDPDWPEFEGTTDAYEGFPGIRILRIPCGPDRFLPKEELWPHLGEWIERAAHLYRNERSWPDLWTGHYADGGLCAARLEELSGVPFTFTAHSLGAWKLDLLLQGSRDASPNGALPAADARYNFGARVAAERATIARAAAIIANSEAERREQYGHPAYQDVAGSGRDGCFRVIAPGVNREIFSADARSPWEAEALERIRAALERDVRPERRRLPAVISWSRLDPKKNHLALVRAFAHNPALRRAANLMIITRGLEDPLRDPGPASEEQRGVLRSVVAEIDRAGLWGIVTAFSLSGQSVLAALYRWGAATGGVFCLPAEHEPFGMTVVEAMAVGLPVVATSNGGPREITANGHAGLLADPHDPDALAAQLLRLLTDCETWQTYADRGLRHARGEYSWRRAAEGYLRLAEEVTRVGRNARANFPLPDFIRRSPAGELPRLRSWTTARTYSGAPRKPAERRR